MLNPDSKKKKGMFNMLDFSFRQISHGYLYMRITADHKYIDWIFDENFTDPLVQMVNMYKNLKEGKDFCWKSREWQGTLTVTTKFQGDDKGLVLFGIHVVDNQEFGIYDDRKSDEFYQQCKDIYPLGDNEIIAEQEISTYDLCDKFETFFRLLLSSKLFPLHYPCWSCMDEVSHDKIYKEFDEFSNNLSLGDLEMEELEDEFFAEHYALSEEDKEYAKKYENMLRNYEVPEGWK